MISRTSDREYRDSRMNDRRVDESEPENAERRVEDEIRVSISKDYAAG